MLNRKVLKKVLTHKIFETFGIYTGSSILNKALPFFLLPIMTKYLSPVEYGILAIYQALISFSLPFIGMSMENNITKDFYKLSKHEIAKLMSNLIFILFITSSMVMLGIMFYLCFSKSFSGIPARWLYLIPIITFLNMINQFNLVIIRNEQKAFIYGVFEVSSTILQLALSILFVVSLKLGWEGRAHATWIGALIFGFIGIIYMLRTGYLEYDFNLRVIKENFALALPLIPYALGGIIIFFSDRFFIDHFAGKAAVGIYAVGYSFGMIVTLFKNAFAKAWSPWMYRNLSHITEEGKIKIVRFTYLYMIGMIGLALCVTFVSYILIEFMANPRYHNAKEFIVWIALANAVNGMYSIMMPYCVHLGKTKILAWIMFSAAAINLIGNYFLVPINGAVGAAQATLLAFCVSFILNWWYVNKIYPMPWFDKKVFAWRPNGKIFA